MSKAKKWAEENKKLSDKEPGKFIARELTAVVLSSGKLQLLFHEGRYVSVSLEVATDLAKWMQENYGEETSDFSDEAHLRNAAANLSEDILK